MENSRLNGARLLQGTRGLLEMLRAKYSGPNKLCSDYKLAQILELSKTAMTRYTRHGGGMSNEVGMKIAAELDLSPAYVLACLGHEREQSEDIKPHWQLLADLAQARVSERKQTARSAARAKRVSKVAAMLAVAGISAFGAPSPSYSAPASAPSLYIMTNRRRVTNPLHPTRKLLGLKLHPFEH